MSLFLGIIHHWLYNKILWYEETESEIIKLADHQVEDIEGLCESN